MKYFEVGLVKVNQRKQRTGTSKASLFSTKPPNWWKSTFYQDALGTPQRKPQCWGYNSLSHDIPSREELTHQLSNGLALVTRLSHQPDEDGAPYQTACLVRDSSATPMNTHAIYLRSVTCITIMHPYLQNSLRRHPRSLRGRYHVATTLLRCVLCEMIDWHARWRVFGTRCYQVCFLLDFMFSLNFLNFLIVVYTKNNCHSCIKHESRPAEVLPSNKGRRWICDG